ncbi:MAG: YajQ family cyclic di-GMP-binding protein [Gammaproteobacteria bacterium TMED222]|nr:MAG: YajQ family cyclic di-GMP-binding protein [Gammaproteobacteria bacterium TMED222]
MPSFDIESKVDLHELTNAIDQSNRVITNRYDFKEANASFEFVNEIVKLNAKEIFQIDQMIPILKENLAKRSIDLKALKLGEKSISNNTASMSADITQGINQDIAREIVKTIKSSKIKVQSSIQGDSLRITGKKRDELQEVISLLKKEEIEIPLQFKNFRD